MGQKHALPSSSRPSSIVLTDWAADVDHLRADQDAVIYQLLILSLLYDQILIQDELLVLSDPLAAWFGRGEGQRIWDEALDVGSLVILRHPLSAYPTAELKEYAHQHPLHARAEYLHRFGAKDEHPFNPTPIQRAFYSIVEASLSRDTGRTREVGALRRTEIMPRFAATLESVLRNPNLPWFKATFPALEQEDVRHFQEYVVEPAHLVNELVSRGVTFNMVPDGSGQPTLNRALAYQAASLFPPATETAFRQLIQSVFALPFCWRENAVGRYGGILKAVPPALSRSSTPRTLDGPSVIVDAHVNVPLAMPRLEPGFAKAIGEVRDSPAGKHLREAVARLGKSLTFDEQKARWAAVAEELAKRVATPCEFGVSLDSVVHRLIEGALTGAIVHQALESNANEHDFLLSTTGLLAGGLHATCGIMLDSLRDLWKVETAAGDLCARLEDSVEFRCTWIPEPEESEEAMSA
ncbi:hypothetical protein [Candidatus Methylomirabilis sp.]|uniref:hypothetical protein n=1 Tax=Candidatus Methylomirabilis sp. TaxID=2032687 RepID=UPI00307636DD|nr:hypothetical protein [Rhodocyclaceae bacterium]